MSTVYRADSLGSLLRPGYLKEARASLEAEKISPREFKEIEDRAVDEAIALQEGAGLDVVTDGELRRLTFFDQFLTAVDGLGPKPGRTVSFHDDAGQVAVEYEGPLAVTDRIRRKRMLTVEEYCYARARAHVPVKVTLPSPLMLNLFWSSEHTREAYADPFELFADGVELIRDEAQELRRLGCEYIQIDAPDFGLLVDETQAAGWEASGISVDRALAEGVDMLNAVADAPGVTFGLHLCKGNYESKWISRGGYEKLSTGLFPRVTNYDVFLLEYDDERSGSFEPLEALPDDKVVVLGLVSSKREGMEPAEELVGRIDEASRYFPREQLALSTQCGFASAGGGNEISEQAQEAKLRLVADVADRVWG